MARLPRIQVIYHQLHMPNLELDKLLQQHSSIQLDGNKYIQHQREMFNLNCNSNK